MKLTKIRVHEFQSIRDSNEFQVGDVTCLVGKNEAGKSAILKALYKLNPIVSADADYSVTDDYPRWDVEDYQHEVEAGDRDDVTVVEAYFSLDTESLIAVTDNFGEDALKNDQMMVRKGYANKLGFELNTNTEAAIQHLISERDFSEDTCSKLSACKNFKSLAEALDGVEHTEAASNLLSIVTSINKHINFDFYLFHEILWPRAPKFLYFDEYYQMEGRANIPALQQRSQNNTLNPSDHPLLGLIRLARLDFDDLLNPGRTRGLKNKLEGAGNHLTKSVVKYWSQNQYLQLRFDVREGCPDDPEGLRDGSNIWGEVYDTKHMVTTELGTRSRGFVWFFSFLAWYSDVKREQQNVVLLLDEPGLSLHAKAQGDLLRYFESEIKGKHQLIYSTHSPFLVDPHQLGRVRIVQDRSIETDKELDEDGQGTKVITDVLEATEDSLFPLQGALGYEISQSLFIGPNCLVVEGVSDLLYLQTISALLQARGEAGLSRDWTITPVGGAGNVPTFVSLLGAQKGQNVVVLIDYHKKDHQSIDNLYKEKLLQKKQVLTFADFVDGKEADIEDMFNPGFYLKLVNGEFKSSISIEDIEYGHPRLLARLENYLAENPLSDEAVFNHYRPARYLTENISTLEDELTKPELDHFRKAFEALNALLG